MAREVVTLQGKDSLREEIPQCYPFVKWAGGKSQLLSEYAKFLPKEFHRYFEPFLGGGAMFFYLISNNSHFSAYLSDRNSELINTYNMVKIHVEELIKVLQKHQAKFKRERERAEYYYQLRQELKPLNNVERAARFIALNKTCYNGLYRVNKSGKFNVPMGKYKNPLICDAENLRNISLALRHSKAKFVSSNYKKILADAGEGDFIYLDPPYDPTSITASFTSYTHDGFTDDDQKELAELFTKLADRRCKVMLSNSNTPFIRKLYQDYSDYTVKVQALRNINCKGSKRSGYKELLIRNYS